MEKEIVVKIISDENPYEFKGKSILNRDLLYFDDNNYHNIYDFKTNRLIRENKDLRIVIDYSKEEISFVSNNMDLNFKFKVMKKKIKLIDIDISYKIKYDLFRLIIKEV